MSKLAITCDRAGVLMRAAVWDEKGLRDLYLDWLDRPNMVGAMVAGKVVRVLAAQKAAFIDAGLEENIYVSGVSLKAGALVAVEITSPARQGKAFAGKLLPDVKAEESGVISPAPQVWQRAITDCGDNKIAGILFAQAEDHAAYAKWIAAHQPHLSSALQPLAKEPVHPDLSDRISALNKPRVALPPGAELVIEETEALTAVDVNGGEAANPLALNIQAARELARQMRLRNLSGIIVMDALKLKQRTDVSKLLATLKTATADDPAGVEIFGMTKLGLIEMTRRRRGPSLHDIMREIDE